MTARDVRGHRFTVYPRPSTAALPVPAGGFGDIVLGEQLAGPPVGGAPYAQMMFMQVAMSGGTVEPTLMIVAGSGDAVTLSTDPLSIYRSATKAGWVGDGWIEQETDGVYRINVGFEELTTETWKLRIGNNDPIGEYRFTLVVAADPADAAQPWIDVAPHELSFDVLAGQSQTARVTVSNLGTGPFSLTGIGPLPPELTLTPALPLEVPPAGATDLEVTFAAAAVPPEPDGLLTGSAAVTITPPDSAATAIPGHNGTIGFRARTRWRAPAFGPPGAQFTPTSGPSGTPVTLSGNGFDSGDLVVRFGEAATTPADTVTAASANVVVPDGLPTPGHPSEEVRITVSTRGGSVTSEDAFTVVAATAQGGPDMTGVIYTVNAANELLWYRHNGIGTGAPEWASDTARKVGTGWDVKHVFSGGGGVIYAVNSDDDLLWYRDEGAGNGGVKLTADAGRKVGTGWNVKHIFSAGGGIIYAVNPANELVWFRHEGVGTGAAAWTDWSPRRVGTGWDVKHIFSGGGGVIYCVNPANELMWYRHEGVGNGKVEWTANTGRRVGTGWNFKHLFSGGGGVIYAVNAANDLLWYRHDGLGNGKYEWTDSAPRKAGTGWDFKDVFSGG